MPLSLCISQVYYPLLCKASTNKKPEDAQKPWVIETVFHVLHAI